MNSDEELLYSRQIAAYGSKAMDKISKLNILLIGIRGLGIEISKNIILAAQIRLLYLIIIKLLWKTLVQIFI